MQELFPDKAYWYIKSEINVHIEWLSQYAVCFSFIYLEFPKNVATPKSHSKKSRLGEKLPRYADTTTTLEKYVYVLSHEGHCFNWHCMANMLHNKKNPFWTNSKDLRCMMKQIVVIEAFWFNFKIDGMAL